MSLEESGRFYVKDKELQGATLYPRVFRKLHDLYYQRCACCFSKFTEENCFGCPYQGYATQDDTLWICQRCAAQHGEELHLHLMEK